MKKRLLLLTFCLTFCLIFLVACSCSKPVALQVTSPAFASDSIIPSKYACSKENVNPELNIAGVPSTAESLALIVEDTDAPSGKFSHWVVWNIPPQTILIPEASVPGREGTNDYGKTLYSGPCPPSGKHSYHFKVYALNTILSLPTSATKTDLESAMKGNILGFGELVGVYEKN